MAKCGHHCETIFFWTKWYIFLTVSKHRNRNRRRASPKASEVFQWFLGRNEAKLSLASCWEILIKKSSVLSPNEQGKSFQGKQPSQIRSMVKWKPRLNSVNGVQTVVEFLVAFIMTIWHFIAIPIREALNLIGQTSWLPRAAVTYWLNLCRCLLSIFAFTTALKVKWCHNCETHMLRGVRQLLLDLLHHLPEGRPVERVSIPAGSHDLVPAAEGKQRNV